MNPVDLMNHTLSALVDSQKPKRPDPPYDRVCRVEVTVEILVPVWADLDDDGVTVTMAPESEWKLAAPISERTRTYIEEQCVEEVEEAECRRKRDDWESRDDRGDWEYEQRKDKAT